MRKENDKKTPLLSLSFTIGCFRLLSLILMYSHLLAFGVATMCMRRPLKYERNLLTKSMREENNTKTRPLLSLSFTLVCFCLQWIALIYSHLLSLGVEDDLHDVFVQVRADFSQEINTQGTRTNKSPVPSLSCTLVCSRVLSLAFIYSHLPLFGVGDDLHEAIDQIRPKSSRKVNVQGEQNNAAAPFALIYYRLLSFTLTCFHLLSFALV